MVDLDKLSKFAAEFLRKNTTYIIDANPERIFNDWKEAPILAHLAKREMEKRKVSIYKNDWEAVCWTCGDEIFYSYSIHGHYFENENEYTALWSAIFEAVGGEK